MFSRHQQMTDSPTTFVEEMHLKKGTRFTFALEGLRTREIKMLLREDT